MDKLEHTQQCFVQLFAMKDKKKTLFTRRNFIGTSIIGGASAFSYARWIEPNQVTVTEKELTLPHLPPALDGLTVAHLTDFHYNPQTDEKLISEAVAKTNAANPDIIALTGDYVTDDNTVLAPLISQLAKLKAKHGIYGVMGNHDGWAVKGWSENTGFYRKAFEAVGIEFLVNQGSTIQIRGEKVFIAGTDSIWSGIVDAPACWKGHRDETVLALVHEPDVFDQLINDYRVDLQLSGHTHGGQCRVPFIGYAPAKVRYGKNYIYGNYTKGDSQIFVSRGLGTVGIRVRFACAPEVAILKLRSANSTLTNS